MGVNQPSYIFLRKNTYYFSRRVPPDMKELYSGSRIVKSLRTRSRRVALRGSHQINFHLENHWSSIRVERITCGLASKPVVQADSMAGCGFDMLETRDHYMTLKGKGKGHVFERTVDRNVDYFVTAVGNKDLGNYSSTDGARFRDFLIAKGL
ncbi:MAG: integrase, partial [Gammaproteobacteria bacterium]|nr:integrase [Gammaproteobacteria bacterium]